MAVTILTAGITAEEPKVFFDFSAPAYGTPKRILNLFQDSMTFGKAQARYDEKIQNSSADSYASGKLPELMWASGPDVESP